MRELEKCVCGNPNIVIESHDGAMEGSFYKLTCNECRLSTGEVPSHRVELAQEKSERMWQTMQRALKSGWTSEVPTEEGRYLFKLNGEQEIEYVVSELGYDGTTLYFDFYNGEEPCTQQELQDDGWMGLWFRINYPDPPKAGGND